MATNKKITLTLDTFFKIQCTEFFEALGCQVLTEVELFKQPRRLDVLIIEGGEGKGEGEGICNSPKKEHRQNMPCTRSFIF